MKFLVTGHKGYIGQNLLKKINENNFHSTGIDINYFDTYNYFNVNLKKADVDISQDLRKIDKKIFNDIDVVVHLAALSNDPLGKLNPKLTEDINFKLSIKLAEFAKESGVKKFIYSSSCSVYGVSSSKEGVDEDSILNPVTAYAKSKINTEHSLLEMDSNNFKVIFLRNATAFGVSDAMRCDLVVSDLIGSALNNNKIIIKSDGKPWRPLVHIDDISNVIIEFSKLKNSEINYNAYNIGASSMNFKIFEIANLISKKLNNTPVVITNEYGSDTRSYRVNFKRLNEQFNKKVINWDLEKGIEETINYFYRMNIEKKYTDRHFIRLKQLKYLIANNIVNNNLQYID